MVNFPDSSKTQAGAAWCYKITVCMFDSVIAPLCRELWISQISQSCWHLVSRWAQYHQVCVSTSFSATRNSKGTGLVTGGFLWKLLQLAYSVTQSLNVESCFLSNKLWQVLFIFPIFSCIFLLAGLKFKEDKQISFWCKYLILSSFIKALLTRAV